MKEIKVDYEGFDRFLDYLRISNIDKFRIDEDETMIKFEYSNQNELEKLSKELSEMLLYTSIDFYFKVNQIDKKEYDELIEVCRDNLFSMTFYYGTILKINLISYFQNNSIINLESFMNFNIPIELKERIDDLYKKALDNKNKSENEEAKEKKEFNRLLNKILSNQGYCKNDFKELHIRVSNESILFKGENTKEFDFENTKKDFGVTLRSLEEFADTVDEKLVLRSMALIKLFSPKIIYIKDKALKNELQALYGDEFGIK